MLSPSRPFALVALSCLACASLAAAAPAVSFVHLAPDSDVTVMHVQWSSAVGAAGIPVVQWGRSPSALTGSQAGYSWVWKDGGRTYQANLASMSGLQPGSRVFYRVGCDQDGWSTVNNFTAIRSADSYTSMAPLRIAWLGDMGAANAQALPYLLKEATSFSFFIDVGDFAYDLDSSNGETGDLFQQSIEPITVSLCVVHLFVTQTVGKPALTPPRGTPPPSPPLSHSLPCRSLAAPVIMKAAEVSTSTSTASVCSTLSTRRA